MSDRHEDLAGRPVRLHLTGDPAFGGVAVRWGVVREVTPAHLIIDGYHDSSGIGAYIGGRYMTDGVPVARAEVLGAWIDWRKTYAEHAARGRQAAPAARPPAARGDGKAGPGGEAGRKRDANAPAPRLTATSATQTDARSDEEAPE